MTAASGGDDSSSQERNTTNGQKEKEMPNESSIVLGEELAALRRSLYPGIYDTNEELSQDMERSAVEQPVSRTGTVPPSRRQQTPAPAAQPRSTAVTNYATTGMRQQVATLSATTTGTTATGQQQQQSQSHSYYDIWGRIPLKEPPHLITCSICTQKVNGLRFASHLDKCLGIGTMSRNKTTTTTNAAASSSASATNRNGHYTTGSTGNMAAVSTMGRNKS